MINDRNDLTTAVHLVEEICLLMSKLVESREAALPIINEYLSIKRRSAEKLSDLELVTVLRTTFAGREFFAEWPLLRDIAFTELTSRHGKPHAEVLLRGLLGEVTPRELSGV